MDFRGFEEIVLYINSESSLNVINIMIKVTIYSEIGKWLMWDFESFFSIKGLG